MPIFSQPKPGFGPFPGAGRSTEESGEDSGAAKTAVGTGHAGTLALDSDDFGPMDFPGERASRAVTNQRSRGGRISVESVFE